MQTYKFFLDHRWEIAFFSLFLVVGIFLRTYHFSDWLHFEIDQSYDALLVSPAVEEGIAHLPLLGPTAGGGRALRLGPAFYYMEYVSAKLFGNTPPGHAMLVLVLSLLSLPLFYIFCRRYFSKPVALGLLAVFSVSLYSVLYSRFSWSPNILPFFILLSLYALLRSVSSDEKKKDRWFLVTTVSVAILTQIHFNAFFTVPPIVILFLAIKRPRFRVSTWIAALFICFLIYLPVIVSDIKMHGENTQYFLEKMNKGGHSSPLRYNVVKFVQTTQYYASEVFLITTGVDHINGKGMNGYGFKVDENLIWRVAALVLFFLQSFLLFRNTRREKNIQRRDFLLLCGLWLIISFLYFFSLSRSGFRLYPRFFLLISPLAIVLLGLMIESFQPEAPRKRLAFLVMIFSLIGFSNMNHVVNYFKQLSQSPLVNFPVETEDVLPNTARVTLAQQYAISDYIASKYQENGYPVYLKTEHEYEPVLWYHLEKRGIHYYDSFARDNVFYEQGNYFVVSFSSNRAPKIHGFSVSETQPFGTLAAYYLQPLPSMITYPRQEHTTGTVSMQHEQLAKIYTWKKLFSEMKE